MSQAGPARFSCSCTEPRAVGQTSSSCSVAACPRRCPPFVPPYQGGTWGVAAQVGRRYARQVWCGLFVGVTALSAWPTRAQADAFARYQLSGGFELPAGTDVFDVLADGRVIALVGDTVEVETALGSRTFMGRGPLPGADLPFFGAAFLRVSPDGTRIAVGNNGGGSFGDFKVGVFDLATLSGEWFVAGHFDAEWTDDTHLAITSGDFVNPSVVTVLDVASPDPSDPSNPIVVNNIGGASGGIAFDAAGNLFTGNGFTSTGPSGTGAAKAFPRATWMAALSGGPVIDFESDGVLVVDVLSASPLVFDNEGNLFVGGGDLAPDADFVALVRGSAVAAALAGAGPVDPNDPAQVRRLDPIPGNDFNFYLADFNRVTGEIYVRDFGDDTVHVYRDGTSIPTVSEWGLIVMSLLLLTTGTLVLQQRRWRLGGTGR